MQGLADGYFVIPYTIGGYLAGTSLESVSDGHAAFKASVQAVSGKIDTLLSINGKRTVDDFHRHLGLICGTIAAWRATMKVSKRPSE